MWRENLHVQILRSYLREFNDRLVKKHFSLLTNQHKTHATMNLPLANHCARRNGDIWPAHPMQGVLTYPIQGDSKVLRGA